MVELGESASAAALREVKEETGLSVRIESLLDVGADIHRDATGRIEYHFVLVDYVASPVGGRVELSDESSDYGWFDEHEAEGADMSEGTRDVLRMYFDRGRPKSIRSARRSPRTRLH